jgi:hypothetical protein
MILLGIKFEELCSKSTSKSVLNFFPQKLLIGVMLNKRFPKIISLCSRSPIINSKKTNHISNYVDPTYRVGPLIEYISLLLYAPQMLALV